MAREEVAFTARPTILQGKKLLREARRRECLRCLEEIVRERGRNAALSSCHLSAVSWCALTVSLFDLPSTRSGDSALARHSTLGRGHWASCSRYSWSRIDPLDVKRIHYVSYTKLYPVACACDICEMFAVAFPNGGV